MSKILLLSAYDTPSHRGWCKGLQKYLPEFEWTYLTLPGRYFSWRIRGNPFSWLGNSAEILNQQFDTILATSMVDLATICGLFPNLGRARKIVYFHENQFDYPLSELQKSRNLEAMMVQLYSSLAADVVLFNSDYNRDSYFTGVQKFLKMMPDFNSFNPLEKVKKIIHILPVPINSRERYSQNLERIPNSIVWNHRWEYDKNPEAFFEACRYLKEWKVDFKLIVMGQQFRKQPDIFTKAKAEFSEEILCWGEQPYEDYLNWLQKAEWVISTAIHEFQGVAVMEAVQAGCNPAVPNRLSYPQWFGKDYLYGETGKDLALYLKNHFEQERPVIPELEHLCWDRLIGEYRGILEQTN